MLNFRTDPGLLQPYVPAGTELDFRDGETYISIVGFLFQKTRLLGFPVPFHRKFEEVNLRFYVRRLAGKKWRRGVCFLREIAPKPAVSFVARRLYGERYITLPMKHRIEPELFEYGWKNRGRWNQLQVQTTGEPVPLPPGFLEEFIAEHYWGYTSLPGGGSMEYRVSHPPWKIRKPTSAGLDCDVKTTYGSPFMETLSGDPESSFVADGSEVAVYRGTRI